MPPHRSTLGNLLHCQGPHQPTQPYSMQVRHAQGPQHSSTCRAAGRTAHGAEAAGDGAGAGMGTRAGALRAGVVVALNGTTEGTGVAIGEEEARGATCSCSHLLDRLYCPNGSGGLRVTLQLQDSTKGTHQVCWAAGTDGGIASTVSML